MGSSGEDPNKGIDATVGALVWVRRRNGSWWPGKILSPDELPEGSLPTPRSGTPVKLLGRDDASVDWYNLEKSKRVKAFHCSEYDDCIEKVKASSSINNLSKKSVNQARREDAILHALKLENARLGKDSSPTPPEDDTLSIDESEEREDNDKDFNTSEDESDLAPENPAKEEEFNNPNNNNNNNSEEEEDEEGTLKRTRGLEDINIASSLKRKRSHFQEILKRKSRRRTLTKVLECTTIMSENKDSVLESYELKKDSSLLIGNNNNNGVLLDDSMKCKQENSETSGGPEVPESSRILFDVHLVAAEEKPSAGLPSIVSDKPQHIQVGGGAHNEPGSTSQWRSKGKRNSRTRKVNIKNEAEKYTVDPVTETEVKGFRGWSWNIPPKDSRVPHRSLPYRQSRFTVNPKYDSSDFSLGHHNNSDNNNNNHNISGSDLFDVAVEVEMGYRPQQVPYISLMSKINGRPIVGHHLAVDVLDNGSCDDLIDFYSSGSEMERKPRGRPPKPGRRSRNPNRSPKKNGQLSKKTRKLSALTGAHRLSREEKKKKTIVEKVNKGPSIACVPLNVVFSRLNGCLNGSVRPVTRPNSTQQ